MTVPPCLATRILTIATRYSRSREEADRPLTAGYPPPAQVLSVLYNAIFLDLDDDVLVGRGDVRVFDVNAWRRACGGIHFEDAEPGRDEFELDLARRALSADLPVLAICRGAQVLNVAAGGTLVQFVQEVDVERDTSRPPLAQVSFMLHKVLVEPMSLAPGLVMSPESIGCGASPFRSRDGS